VQQAPNPRSAVRKVQPRGFVQTPQKSVVETIQLSSISVEASTNPRRRLRDIDELAASIRDHGLLQPLVVRRDKRGVYSLIAGHRRLAALQKLAEESASDAWSLVPVVIREEDPDQAYVLTLVENLQREDLTAAEESEALGRLVRERRWTTRQIASAIQRSQTHVSRRLRVYEDKALRTLVINQQLLVSVAEELLAADEDSRAGLAKRAVREQWDQKRARAEARGYTAAFHPGLRRQIHDLREMVANASLSVGEQTQLRQLAEFLLNKLAS
jgi:ParB family transcriptional regulator, chromosome partitioning protein